jgi:hypothetical protein
MVTTTICPTVKMLWVNAELSTIERLSMCSFVACGHDVELFTYGKVAGIPDGVRVRDAREVLPESRAFYCKRSRSVAAFANWFRRTDSRKHSGRATPSGLMHQLTMASSYRLPPSGKEPGGFISRFSPYFNLVKSKSCWNLSTPSKPL